MQQHAYQLLADGSFRPTADISIIPGRHNRTVYFLEARRSSHSVAAVRGLSSANQLSTITNVACLDGVPVSEASFSIKKRSSSGEMSQVGVPRAATPMAMNLATERDLRTSGLLLAQVPIQYLRSGPEQNAGFLPNSLVDLTKVFYAVWRAHDVRMTGQRHHAWLCERVCV